MRPLTADELPCGFVELDRSGRIADANAVVADWTGRTRDQLIGRPIESVLVVPAGVGLEASGVAWVVRTDGTERPVLESRSTTPAGERVVLVDASERVAFEEVLTRSRALEARTRSRLELVIEASIAFSAATTEAELGEILATTVARAYSAERSVVFLVDDRGTFEQVAGTNPLEEIIGARSLPAQAALLRRVVTISSAEEAEAVAPMLAEGIRESGVHAVLAAPILHDDVLLGVFACFFLHPRQFDNEAAPLADALSGQAAQTATSLRLQRQLAHAAMHDETTGLPNRRLLEAQVIEYSQAGNTLIAALFVDLDGFKQVNDTLGHHVGDELLREVGQRIQAAVRQQDLVARYGGDEFVVVCEVPDRASAHEVAERIRAAVEEPFADLPADMPVSASIGLSAATAGDLVWNPDRLIRAADHAMYVAKSWGGNRVVDALTAEQDEPAAGA